MNEGGERSPCELGRPTCLDLTRDSFFKSREIRGQRSLLHILIVANVVIYLECEGISILPNSAVTLARLTI